MEADVVDKLLQERSDLAMLVRRLYFIVERKDPGNKTAQNAKDYLKRKGLQGSILRSAELIESED